MQSFRRLRQWENSCKYNENAQKSHYTKISTPDELSIGDLKHHIIVTIEHDLNRASKLVPTRGTLF